MSQTPVEVKTEGAGLVTISPYEKIGSKNAAMVDSGVMDVIPNQTFVVLVMNLSTTLWRMPKGMRVSYAQEAPAFMI